jgi:hypothetical protein
MLVFPVLLVRWKRTIPYLLRRCFNATLASARSKPPITTVVGGNVKCIANHRKLKLFSCSAMLLFHYKLIFITNLALIISLYHGAAIGESPIILTSKRTEGIF